MTTLAAPQKASITITTPGQSVPVTCATGDKMQVDWVSPGGVTGSRLVMNETVDIGPLADNTVVTFTALAGSPTYIAGKVVTAEYNNLTGRNEITIGGNYLTELGTCGLKSPIPVMGDILQLSDFTIQSGSPSLSIVTGPDGRTALKIVCNVGESMEIKINSLSGTMFSGEVYLLTDASYLKGVSQVLYYASPDANRATNFVGAGYSGYNAPLNTPQEPVDGANVLRIDRSQFAVTGSIAYPFVSDFNSFRVIPRAGMAPTVYLYAVGFAPQPKKGRVVVSVDDGYDSWFKLGQPIFDDRGIPVTMAVIPSIIDSGGGAAYTRQLKGLVNRGGAIVAHGPNVGGGAGSMMSAFPDTASRIADMVSVRKWISEIGLATPGFEKCYVWPQGVWQAGSVSDRTLLDAAISAGFNTGRAAVAAFPSFFTNTDSLSKYQHLTLPAIGHVFGNGTMTTAAESANIAAITTLINNAAQYGSDVTLMFHRVQPTATSDGAMSTIGIRVSDLTALADAIATKVTAGTLEAVTLPSIALSSGNYWQQ